MSAETLYQCPGEAHSIERSVHLARLANFYAACNTCPHRADTAMLSPKRARMLDSIAAQSGPLSSLFHAEGIRGVYLNELDANTVRRAATAFGEALLNSPSPLTGEGRPAVSAPNGGEGRLAEDVAVVLAHDGRPWTAELSAAAATGLRRAGCRVIDIGAATAPLLIHSQLRLSAAGAMLLGNSSGHARRIDVTMWSRGGLPCMADGELDAIRQRFDSPALPRQRPFGAVERATFEVEYLAELKGYYHALRPLRVVVECGSAPLLDYLRRLTESVAIEILPSPASACLGAHVVAAGAHFGAHIADDVRRLSLFDQRGAAVPLEPIFLLFAREQLEPPSDGPPCPDALRTLTLLFVLLSRSDRPLSDWIKSAILP